MTTDENEVSDYEALKSFGHSAAMAAVIVLDAKRGDRYCLDWIKIARRKQSEGGAA